MQFISQFLSYRLPANTNIMASSMRTAWSHFGTPPMHFRSHDLINVIFGKTALTPSCFKLKTSNQNLNYPGCCQPNTKISKFLCRNWQKVFKYGKHGGCKILTCYISVTVPDRSMVTIIYR